MAKNCKLGQPCGNSCQASGNLCRINDLTNTRVTVETITKLTSGNYGEVFVTGRGTVIKRNKPGKSFGPHEIEAQRLMGELGFSPRVIRANEEEIEMELVKGKPLWADYKRAEGEPEAFPPTAQKTALKALTSLHRLGFTHGDQHVKQWILDPKTQDVKLIDFGLSKSRSEAQPREFMIDFTKSRKFARYEENSEILADLIGRYVEATKIKNKAQREEAQNRIGQEYLDQLSLGRI